MIYSYNEAINKYKSYYNIKKAINNGELFKIENGIYSDNKYINPMVIYSKKYPKAIITLDSAYYYYDLTDVIPQKLFLATDRKARPIKNKNIQQIFIPQDILNQGCAKVDVQGYNVNMYNKERLLVELVRKKNQMPFDYYKELISNYREIVDELDIYKIEEYVALYKNEVNIFDTIQREVF